MQDKDTRGARLVSLANADLTRSAPQNEDDATTCPRCGESHDLAKVKGCIKCLKCGFKFDCNGW
jgi:hypothetical protein